MNRSGLNPVSRLALEALEKCVFIRKKQNGHRKSILNLFQIYSELFSPLEAF